MTTTNLPANDSAPWTAASWRAHVASYHPSHAAASYALHREQMGRLAPSARVITALTMVGKRNAKLDLETLTYERAMELIDLACAHRKAMPYKALAEALTHWVQTSLPLAAGE